MERTQISHPVIINTFILSTIMAVPNRGLTMIACWLLAWHSPVQGFPVPRLSYNACSSLRGFPRSHRHPRPERLLSVEETAVSEKIPQVQRYYESYQWVYKENSYKINYRVEGPKGGTPILLVHGFGANVNHFRFQFPALVEAGYRVYAIDLLGFGGSDKPKEEEYCIELFTELIVDFIQDVAPMKKWVIGGNSIGGLCSLAAAAELPVLVKAVVLFNCSGGMTGFRFTDVPVYLRPVLWFLQKVVLGPNLGGRFFENFKTRENVESILRQQGVYGDTTNVDEELIEILLGPAEDDGAQQVFLGVFAGPPGPTPESLLPKISCPILALWGTADPWTPIDAGAHPGTSFGDFSDNYTLIPLEGAGHCPHDECPDIVNSAMIEWLSKLDQQRGNN